MTHMILTVFRSRLRADAQEYAQVAHEMETLARQMPGFVSFKTFKNDDGERCSVVEFEDWESHNAWAKHPRHVAAQHQGRDEFYEEFSISVAEVARAYGFRAENQKLMNEYHLNEYHLRRLYDAFNRQDIEEVLAELHPDVRWANGMEGGFVLGRDNVRVYWRKQFETLRPHLEVRDVQEDEQGRALLTIHQTVRDLSGVLLLEQDVRHRFSFENGKIALFEIVESAG